MKFALGREGRRDVRDVSTPSSPPPAPGPREGGPRRRGGLGLPQMSGQRNETESGGGGHRDETKWWGRGDGS